MQIGADRGYTTEKMIGRGLKKKLDCPRRIVSIPALQFDLGYVICEGESTLCAELSLSGCFGIALLVRNREGQLRVMKAGQEFHETER